MFSSNKPTPKQPAKPRKAGQVAPSIISSDVRVTGDIVTPGEVQFDGTIEGNLNCGSLTIGQQAGVTGAVVADNVVVHGAVIGSLRARAVHLSKTAKVVGDITHETLVIDSGAYVEGRCLHVDDPLETPAQAPAQAQDATPAETDAKIGDSA